VPDIISYYRVSTRKQGDSGLGLEGQQSAVEAYAKATGGRIVATYREVESGKLAERPELNRALAHAKRSKATLVVAKLDRLARNVAFLSTMMRAGVDFIACDNPNANKLTVHILAAVAEDEAERISARTKAALQAAKDAARC
jgi:DNA invertase Pin-like site-specific DNA recombinase